MSKQRHYYYIQGKDPADSSKLKFVKRDIECDDTFEGELIMLAFPIKMMEEISTVLSNFHLRNDAEYFYSECKEVVSVPEKHVNEKGQGNLTFQSYFHKFPESVNSFFDDVIVVVILHPQPGTDANTRNYNMIAYIHVNIIDFKSPDGEVHQGYYYNVLRLSEQTVNGEAIYRRKRIFSSMYSILLDIVTFNQVHYVYATMGRENQAINDALKMNTERNGKFFETFPMSNNSHINLILGSSSASKKLVDISKDKEALREYYSKIKDKKDKYVFNQMHCEDNFFRMVDRIMGSSPTSRIYMLPDAKGNFDAAGLFVNWGDYLHLKLQNPKGLFKAVDSLGITDKILYPTLLVGSKENARSLVKGAAYRYRKDHKVQITILNAYEGDPYADWKKSIIHDPFVYFVIHDKPDQYEEMKAYSKNVEGTTRIFIDTPMI